MKFEEFKIGQTFKSYICIDKHEFVKYISFARTKNILHEKPELAAKEGIKGILLPGRAILARAEGEMTRLDIFSIPLCCCMEWMEILSGIIGILGFWVKCMQVTNSR